MGLIEVIKGSLDIMIKNPKIVFPYMVFVILASVITYYIISEPLNSALTSELSILNQTIKNQVGSGSAYPSSLPSNAAIMAGFYTSLLHAINIPLTIILLVTSALVELLLTGFYVSVVKQSKSGGKISIISAFEMAGSRYLPLLVAGIITTLITIGFIAILGVLVLVGALAGGAGLAIMLILTFIIATIGAIALAILFYQVAVCVIIEEKSGFEAVKRSIQIGRANMLTIFALFIIVLILGGIANFIFELVVSPIFAISDIGASSLNQSAIQSGNLSTIFGIPFLVATMILSALDSLTTVWIIMIAPLFYYEYVQKGKSAAKSKK